LEDLGAVEHVEEEVHALGRTLAELKAKGAVIGFVVMPMPTWMDGAVKDHLDSKVLALADELDFPILDLDDYFEDTVFIDQGHVGWDACRDQEMQIVNFTLNYLRLGDANAKPI
jgi:hypothetical protein